jgi:drug/metabolite transporter (DMT)-like permease
VIGAAFTAPALGIASAVSWGAGDFCGGLATRKTSVSRVVIGSQLFGAAVLAVLALLSHEGAPPAGQLLWCSLAGLSGAVGLLSLYRALAVGRMGLAAPVSGVLSAAVPVAVAALLQGPPGVRTSGGFALALVAVWLVSRTDGTAFRFRDLGLPVAAGLGFGLFIVIITRASVGAVFWPLVTARLASLAALTLVVTALGQPRLPSRGDIGLVALAGVFDAGGNAFVVLAAHAGRLDVAAVLSSLYPASTVLLARLLLREQVTRWQMVGVAMAAVAIVMITLR